MKIINRKLRRNKKNKDKVQYIFPFLFIYEQSLMMMVCVIYVRDEGDFDDARVQGVKIQIVKAESILSRIR
jgi:hypothetical protein